MNQGYWDATIETLTLVLVGRGRRDADRRAARHLGGASGRRLYAAMRPGARPDADAADLRLPDADAGAVRARRRAGPDLDHHLRAARADPADPARHLVGAARPLREAGQAFGATPLQLLFKVELPSAAPMILAGITQCIMLSLSMVVIAALVGAGGLGVPVVRALNTVQVGMGFEAGLAIVLLAIMLDRICRPAGHEGPGMNAAVEFDKVDILFSRRDGPQARGGAAGGAAAARRRARTAPRSRRPPAWSSASQRQPHRRSAARSRC